jgi:ADP-heptose:LPS heptosyltransferase
MKDRRGTGEGVYKIYSKRIMLFENVKKILLIQLGDIGDVVWMTPALWAVKAAYQGATLSLLLREGSASLLEADPAVDEIFEVKKYTGRLAERWGEQLAFLRDFRSAGFDLVIDLRADERGSFMALLSGAPIRIAQYYRGLSFWRNRMFNHLVHAEPRASALRIGAAEQTLCILREVGIEATETVPRLWVRPEVSKRVRALLQEEKIADLPRWCSLNPFSRWPYKEMPREKWVEIMAWLSKEFGLATLIVGAEMERKKAGELAASCSGNVYNLAGKTCMAELAALLQLSSLHIGVDSAAPHIAAAVGTPTVTIYGPSDWRDWAPPGDRHRVVSAGEDCAPCHRKGCDNSNISKCLEDFSVEKIKAVLREVMTSSGCV